LTVVLKVEDLSKRFEDLTAVDRLSFEVREREIFGLIGPDGAGKTTTMRMIAGLILPDAGRSLVAGFEVPGREKEAHEVLGYMPQQYSLYGDLSVEENLRFFAGLQGVRKNERIDREHRLLAIARLEEFRDRPAAALSGGMYKKLALSCSLIHRPRVLLLDEPTNGVDPLSRRELWAFLHELLGEGMAVVISTPYMDEAERCDRVGLLVEGRLVATDRPEALKKGFRETIFEIETGESLRAREVLRRLGGVSRVYTVGKKLHAATPEGPGFEPTLRKAISAEGITDFRMLIVPPSFEDVFLHISSTARNDHETD